MTKQALPNANRKGKGKPAPAIVLKGDDVALHNEQVRLQADGKRVKRFTYDHIDDEAADEFLKRMSDGRSMRSICQDNDMPATQTIRAWLARSSSFTSRYIRAREEQADAIFDEALHLADQASLDPELTHEKLGAVRLQIDTRKWIASKLRPSKYSDKHISEISGPNGGPIQMQGLDLDAIDHDQREALAHMLRAIGATQDGDVEDL